MEKTSSGLQENVASLLCYLFLWLSGLIFLLIEPNNKTVRFHAIQSICFTVIVGVVSIAIAILSAILTAIVGALWFIGGFLGFVFGTLAFIVWILLMVRAYQEKLWKLPVIGEMAAKWAGI